MVLPTHVKVVALVTSDDQPGGIEIITFVFCSLISSRTCWLKILSLVVCSCTHDVKSATRCRGHHSSRVETSVVMKYSVTDDTEGGRRYLSLSDSFTSKQ